MRPRAASRLAWGLFAVVLFELALNVVFEVLAERHGATGVAPSPSVVVFAAIFFLFPLVGVVLASRRPENSLGWLLLAVGIFAFFETSGVADLAISTGHPQVAATAAALGAWTWVPMIGLSGVFILLLFPNGHLPSPRWRWFAWASAIGMAVASLAIVLSPGDLAEFGYPSLQNPFGVDGLQTFLPLMILGVASIPLGVIGAAISLFVRSRRADPVEKQQIRWLASASAVVATAYAFVMAAPVATQGDWASGAGWVSAVQTIAIALFGLLPLSIGVAVLKYRLFDLDFVVRKAVVIGLLAATITIVYVAVVVGVGALVGSKNSAVLSALAAGVVAIAIQPLRARARRVADRVVYGKRATPYEVLAEFGQRVGETYAADDVLPRMARILAEGVGAAHARVWLQIGGNLRVVASWPGPTQGEDDLIEPVTDGEEQLGALSVRMPPNDPIDPAKERLAADLAAQARLVLRNVRLTEELRARLDDLKAAQKRLVTAQDHERRRLERNIHDGAQQQLVALGVKARLARTLTERDPARASEMLAQIESETQTALEDLRDLARGIYPPLLADKGLVAALEAQARKAPVPVTVRADGVGRYPQEAEAAAYFSCLEAIQNVAKYARASRVDVSLADGDGRLRFEVIDDGLGFDPSATGYGTGLQGIADRLGALDGTLTVRSAPGEGTTIACVIPVTPTEVTT
ncbi:MAG: sensor histidine kinase [Planctomycetaceae bacterium]